MNNEVSPTPTSSNLEGRPLDQAEVFAIKRAARKKLRTDTDVEADDNSAPSSAPDLPGPLEWRGEIYEDPNKVAKRIAKAVGAGLTRDTGVASVRQDASVNYKDGPEGSYIGVDSDGEVVDMIFPDEWEH